MDVFSDASDTLADALRARICLASPDEDLVLHETKLAEEFGVSRTPIRQVLQRLAHEHLVETRPGVGTIAARLDVANFERDLKAAETILTANIALCVHPVPKSTKLSLFALSAYADQISGGEDTKAALVDVAGKLIRILTPCVEDPILRGAYAAIFWRIVRWRIRAFSTNPDATWARFTGLIQAALEGSAEKEPGAMFAKMAERARSGGLPAIMNDLTRSQIRSASTG